MSTRELPDRAQIVIVGGGVVGASVAYHPTKLGRTDVVLLSRASCPAARRGTPPDWWVSCAPPESGTRLVQYSTALYAELEAETGSAPYKQCGGVTVARTGTDDAAAPHRRQRGGL